MITLMEDICLIENKQNNEYENKKSNSGEQFTAK